MPGCLCTGSCRRCLAPSSWRSQRAGSSRSSERSGLCTSFEDSSLRRSSEHDCALDDQGTDTRPREVAGVGAGCWDSPAARHYVQGCLGRGDRAACGLHRERWSGCVGDAGARIEHAYGDLVHLGREARRDRRHRRGRVAFGHPLSEHHGGRRGETVVLLRRGHRRGGPAWGALVDRFRERSHIPRRNDHPGDPLRPHWIRNRRPDSDQRSTLHSGGTIERHLLGYEPDHLRSCS